MYMLKCLFIIAVIFLGLGQTADIDVEQPDGTTDNYTLYNDNGELVASLREPIVCFYMERFGGSVEIINKVEPPWSPYWAIFQENPEPHNIYHITNFGGVVNLGGSSEYKFRHGWNKDVVVPCTMTVWNIVVNDELSWYDAWQNNIVFPRAYDPTKGWTYNLEQGKTYWFYAFQPCGVSFCG